MNVRATALLADVHLPPDYWSYACRWVAYIHTHRVTEIPINKALPHFGDVVVMHHAKKKPPSFENRGTTGMCLGHDGRIAGGVLVVSVVNGELKEVCSAKVRTLGEKVGQAWRRHVHPQDMTKAAYVNRKGEVKWSLHEIEVPTVERCVKEDALEMQDIRELGLGWAWFMNDLRAFLPASQEMELASPSTEEPVTQIEADVPIEPLALQADATHLDLDLQVYERPLAVTPFGALKLFLIGRTLMQCMFSWETVVSATGSEQIWVFVHSKVLAEMALQENKWFDVSLETFTLVVFWKTCSVILIFRCHCTVNACLSVVRLCLTLETSRLRLCIA